MLWTRLLEALKRLNAVIDTDPRFADSNLEPTISKLQEYLPHILKQHPDDEDIHWMIFCLEAFLGSIDGWISISEPLVRKDKNNLIWVIAAGEYVYRFSGWKREMLPTFSGALARWSKSIPQFRETVHTLAESEDAFVRRKAAMAQSLLKGEDPFDP